MYKDHSAHVAGIIGASGINVPNVMGVAPKITIYSWDSSNDTTEMALASTTAINPIRISSHSYGMLIGWNKQNGCWKNLGNQHLFGRYTQYSRDLDSIVFEAKLIVVKSAGNERNDAPRLLAGCPALTSEPPDCFQDSYWSAGKAVAANCIGPGGSGKNVITVGAVNLTAVGDDLMTKFSSFGPTKLGRIKPDLVAHGFQVLSLGSGQYFSDDDHDGKDDVPDSKVASYKSSGTSMAAPVVSGIAALVLEKAKQCKIAMTPAGMRALLVQTAMDVKDIKVGGIVRAHEGPDYATGWGIVNGNAALDLLCTEPGPGEGPARPARLVAGNVLSGSESSMSFTVPAGEAEMRVTLAWDDEPTQNGVLLVDLDLELVAPNRRVFKAWGLNPKRPEEPAKRDVGGDSVNTIEQVSVLKPMAGVWKARVSRKVDPVLRTQDFTIAGP